MAFSHATVPFKIWELPGKGLGMVAISNIPKHSVFVSESPLVFIDDPNKAGIPKLVDILDAFRNLTIVEQGSFRALSATDTQLKYFKQRLGPKGTFPTTEIATKFFVNSHIIMDRYHVLGETIARLNHSCVPNAVARFDPVSKKIEGIAVENIIAGEEIVVAYTWLACSRAKRKEDLKRRGNEFDCQCRACVISDLDPEHRKDSEARRELMDKMASEDKKECKNGPTPSFERRVSRLSSLCLLVSLEPFMYRESIAL